MSFNKGAFLLIFEMQSTLLVESGKSYLIGYVGKEEKMRMFLVKDAHLF